MYPVLFVSLGPGEADLITVKGLKALNQVDCILYPSTLTSKGNTISRALDILRNLDIDLSKSIAFDVPMNKDRSLATIAYQQATEKAKELYLSGKQVAVVAEGDVSFYSSVHYILDALAVDNIPVETIAGIPAFIASGALANTHIVKQEERLNVIPGIISDTDLLEKIQNNETVVLMKVSQCEGAVKSCIARLPKAQYHYFENVGVLGKEFYTKSTDEIKTRKFPYFSLMIIHL